MKGASLFRLFSASSQSLVRFSPKSIQSPKSLGVVRYPSSSSLSRYFYSSESDPWSKSIPDQVEKQQSSNPSLEGVDVVSDEELKRRIERLYNGDEDAIPSIFEAILTRKLAGVNDDESLMKELREKFPMENVEKEGEIDFDDEELDDDDEDY